MSDIDPNEPVTSDFVTPRPDQGAETAIPVDDAGYYQTRDDSPAATDPEPEDQEAIDFDE
jgi:hypothetical protein